MSTQKFLIAGAGGQGVLLIGQMISYSAMYEDKNTTWMPSYGPEMRGGAANCTVIVADGAISSPVTERVDNLVVMNEPSLDKFLSWLVPGGNLFVNTSVITKKIDRDDINVYYVDTQEIARLAVGNDKMANMVMMGAIISVTNVVGLEAVNTTFKKLMTGKKEKFIEPNMVAISAWEKSLEK